MIHIIANPAAGGGRAVPAASALARRMADEGAACHVHVPADRSETQRIAQKVAATGVVVACGGDGTVHDCLQGVMASNNSQATLAIHPVGTGNDIVRGLRDTISTPSQDLVEVLLGNEPTYVDVGSVVTSDTSDDQSRYFLGVLSCGFDSTVNERANAMPAKVGRARYLLGVARELPSYRPRWFAIDSDGADRSLAAMVVAVGNGPAYGSGMYICPSARSDDGLFDVTVVTDAPKRTFVSVLPKVYTGKHVEHQSVESWRARELRIDAPDSVVYADGERIGHLPARISMLSARLGVLISGDGGDGDPGR